MFRSPASFPKFRIRDRIGQIIVTSIVALIIISWFFRTTKLPETFEETVALAQASNPKESARFYFDKAMEHMQMSEWEQAEKMFTEAIQIDDSNAEAYHQRGIARGQLLKIMEAKLDQNHAIRLDTHHAGAYRERGWISYLQGKSDEGIEDLKKSTSIKEDYEAFAALGTIYCNQQQWLLAIEALSKTIELLPDGMTIVESSIYYEVRGLAYLSTGQIEPGIDDMDKASFDPFARRRISKRLSDFYEDRDRLSPDSPLYKKIDKLIKRLEA